MVGQLLGEHGVPDEPVGEGHGGIGRRDVLRGGAAAVGAAWATPMIVSVRPLAAAAVSPPPGETEPPTDPPGNPPQEPPPFQPEQPRQPEEPDEPFGVRSEEETQPPRALETPTSTNTGGPAGQDAPRGAPGDDTQVLANTGVDVARLTSIAGASLATGLSAVVWANRVEALEAVENTAAPE